MDKQDKGKQQPELPAGLKPEFVSAEELNRVKLQVRKGPVISPLAIQMSERMLKDQSGAKVPLNTKALQEGKDTVKRLLRRDLEKCAKRGGHRHLAVRVIESDNELCFYYESKRTQAAAAE
jgi:hypothetical protein